ncbi:hypothetical protein BGW80DRAFT_1312353 [Lactifluus volemus]|nr:hypothetical protein BGW80DRAFT_1312353 [Lactifluus volemus]
MRILPAPGTDEHNYGQLVTLLRDKGYYAIAGWEIQGTGRPTMNFLIASFAQGLLGAAFPISGIPEIPKPRLPQLDPVTRQALVNTLPPQVRSLPEPQLNFVIMQMLARQQQKRLQAQQGAQMPSGGVGAGVGGDLGSGLMNGGLGFATGGLGPLGIGGGIAPAGSIMGGSTGLGFGNGGVAAVVPRQPQHQPQQQPQQADRFPQNTGTNVPSAGSMPLKQGELNPFLPGSQANVMASRLLLGQPTSLQQVRQRQQQQRHQQQAHTQHQQQQSQQQQARQNLQRAAMDMQLALSGASGVAMQGGMNGASIGLGFGGLTSGAALDGSSAGEGPGGGGLSAGAGMGGLAPGAAGRVTLDMFQSFMHHSGEGSQGQ